MTTSGADQPQNNAEQLKTEDAVHCPSTDGCRPTGLGRLMEGVLVRLLQ
jgi:hypothetical protein